MCSGKGTRASNKTCCLSEFRAIRSGHSNNFTLLAFFQRHHGDAGHGTITNLVRVRNFLSFFLRHGSGAKKIML